MDVIRHILSHPRRFTAPVLTLGNFDGVHRGHQAILACVVAAARRLGGEAVAMTFEPHPLAILHPERAPAALTPLRDKLALIAATGVDVLVVQRFTREFAGIEAEAFVERFAVGRLRAPKIVVGHRVNFGHERRGDARMLEELAARGGFAVEVVGPIRADGHEVSSSRIRRAVAAGDMQLAATLLGRSHRVAGRVVQGKQRGAMLGFPTANIDVGGSMVPPDGVYAAVAETPGGVFPAIANIGRNPTFGDNARSLEAHLFDFQGNLYGQRCHVAFIERLRDEIAFPTAEALATQIRRDAQRVRGVLAEHGVVVAPATRG